MRGNRFSRSVARFIVAMLLVPLVVRGQAPVTDAVRPFVSVDAPVVALTHVRVIDGTGAPARGDQTIVIEGGRISRRAARS